MQLSMFPSWFLLCKLDNLSLDIQQLYFLWTFHSLTPNGFFFCTTKLIFVICETSHNINITIHVNNINVLALCSPIYSQHIFWIVFFMLFLKQFMIKQITSGTPFHQSLTWSTIALAADIALDSFLALITAAPLCWTVYWKKKKQIRLDYG